MMVKFDGTPSVDYVIIGGRFVCKCIDWAKDIIFLSLFTHKTAFAAIFIGTFTIAPMTFAIMQILILTKDQYCEIYGDHEFCDITKESEGCCKFYTKLTCYKINMVIREIFMLQSKNEYRNLKTYKRILRHQFFIAIFQNLIMAVFILQSTFEQGHTAGAFLWFSTIYSMCMCTNGLGSMLPWAFSNLYHTAEQEADDKKQKMLKLSKIPLFIIVWAFPNFICGLPFLRYFTNEDRTPWMIENGFETGEMKED